MNLYKSNYPVKGTFLYILLGFLLILCLPQGYADNITYPRNDTYVRSDSPATPNPSATSTGVQSSAGSGDRETYFLVNFSTLTTPTFLNAYLVPYVISSSILDAAYNISFYYCNSTVDILTVTWNTRNTVTNCYSASVYSKPMNVYVASGNPLTPINFTDYLNLDPDKMGTIKMNITPLGGTDRFYLLASMETATPSQRPFIDYNYTESIPPTPPVNITNLTYPPSIGYTYSFFGQTNPFNVTLSNSTLINYISIPLYSYVDNVTMILKGRTLGENQYCFQEQANESVICGGLSSGKYSQDPDFNNPPFYLDYYWKDSNYTTLSYYGGYGIESLYINYTTPLNATSFIWQVKAGHGSTEIFNFTSSDCFNSNKVILRIDSNGAISESSNYFCYTSLNVWKNIGAIGANGQDIFEEGIYWVVNSTSLISNLTIKIDNNVQTIIPTSINFTNVASLNTSLLNSILSTGCLCNNCSLSNSICNIPITFLSGSDMILEVNLSNAGYSYAFDGCNKTVNISSNATMLNFSGYYETNQSLANLSINGGSFITYNLKGLTASSSIYPSYSNIQSFSYCGYPSWAQFDVSYNMNYNEFGTANIRQRSGTGATISSSLTTVPLYVLSSANAIYITISVTDTYSNPLGGVNVLVTRTINGVPFIVQSSVTGDDGVISLFVDATQSYIITASKEGYTTATKTINSPSTAGIYTIQLGTTSTSIPSFSSGVSYSFLPLGILQSNTSYDFMFNITSSYWNFTDCDFSLVSGGMTLSTVAGTFNSSYCGATISFNVSSYTNITAQAVYYLNGTIQTEYHPYLINSYTTGNYSLQTVIDDLNNFSGAGFGWQTKMFLAFVVIVAITMFVSIRFNAIINPESSLILQCGLVLLFSIIGWMTIPQGVMGFSFPSIWGSLNAGAYAIFILDFLVTGGYIAWRHT